MTLSNTNDTEIENLLKLIYEKMNEVEIDPESGSHFNIFEILGVKTKELAHSNFLAALLSYKFSKTDNKYNFLKEFINICVDKDSSKFKERIDKFQVNHDCSIDVEYHTGFKSEIGTEGGRIDIIITDNRGNSIIIENKLYAADQDKQLLRYYNYRSNAAIFYLTLDGKKPSSSSADGLVEGDNYICISYQENIIAWLAKCLSDIKDDNFKMLITQYEYLVKSLTNKTKKDNMKDKIIEDISSDKNKVEAAKYIYNNWCNIKRSIVSKLFQELSKKKLDGYAVKEDKINFKITLDGNYCLESFWGDIEFEALQIRVVRSSNDISTFDDSCNQKSLLKKLESISELGKIIPSQDYNKYIIAVVVNDWSITPWEEILDTIPDKIEKVIKTIISEIKMVYQ